jgi:hypothetical protein
MRRPERLLLWLSQENNSGRWIPQRLVRSSRLGDYWGEGEGTKKEGRGGLFVASSFSQQLSLRVVGWARTPHAARQDQRVPMAH